MAFNSKGEGITNTKICEFFAKWVHDQGYDLAVDVCPCDGGELLFVDCDASDLIEEFFYDHPALWSEESESEVEAHAQDMGELSKAFR